MDGERVADIVLPWPSLGPRLAELEGSRSLAVMAELGQLLTTALKPAGWERAEERLTAAIAAGARPVLQINSHAAELSLLPWELVPLSASGQRLGQGSVLLRYAWPGTRTISRSLDAGPGRVLFAWSDAGGPVPMVEHRDGVLESCRAGKIAFDEEKDVLPHVSLRTLADRLAGGGAPVTALHLLCHGSTLRSAPGLFGLSLDSPGSNAEDGEVDGAALASLLTPYASSLRLVVLCACRAAGYVAGASQLGSVAHALHRAGIQTVIASRALLSVDGSVVFVRRFYRELLRQAVPIEEAFVRARSELNVHVARRDWMDVQLFARSADGDDTHLLLQQQMGSAGSPLEVLFANNGIPFGGAVNLARLGKKLQAKGKSADRPLDQLVKAGALVQDRRGADPGQEAIEDALVAIWGLVESSLIGADAPAAGWSRVVKIVAGLVVAFGGAGAVVSLPDGDDARPGDSHLQGADLQPLDAPLPAPKIAEPGASDTPPAPPSPSGSQPARSNGRLSLVTQNGVREKTRLSVFRKPLNEDNPVAHADDTRLDACLAPGDYLVFTRRTPGEDPVKIDVTIYPGTLSTLCIDVDPGGGLCPGVEIVSKTLIPKGSCP